MKRACCGSRHGNHVRLCGRPTAARPNRPWRVWSQRRPAQWLCAGYIGSISGCSDYAANRAHDGRPTREKSANAARKQQCPTSQPRRSRIQRTSRFDYGIMRKRAIRGSSRITLFSSVLGDLTHLREKELLILAEVTLQRAKVRVNGPRIPSVVKCWLRRQRKHKASRAKEEPPWSRSQFLGVSDRGSWGGEAVITNALVEV